MSYLKWSLHYLLERTMFILSGLVYVDPPIRPSWLTFHRASPHTPLSLTQVCWEELYPISALGRANAAQADSMIEQDAATKQPLAMPSAYAVGLWMQVCGTRASVTGANIVPIKTPPALRLFSLILSIK